MATGLPGYNIAPMNYTGKDGILFHLKEDMSVFLKLSATTDMTFTSPMDVTTQPVQTGQTVTDNVQEKPNTISINGVVVVGYEGAFFQTENTTIVEDFVTTLQRWRTQRQVLRVLCKDGITLESAVCTNFEAKKDNKIENGLNVSLTFQDVNFVVQIGRTDGVEQNANGSKPGAKTKTGAATAKKSLGKTGTGTTAPRTPCQINEDVLNNPSATHAVWRTDMRGGCYRGYENKGGIPHFNERNGAKYIPKGIYGSAAGNITKVPTGGK